MTFTFKFFSLRMSEYEEISVLWVYYIIWQKWRDLLYVFNICIQVKLVNQKDCPVWSRPNQALWKRTEDFIQLRDLKLQEHSFFFFSVIDFEEANHSECKSYKETGFVNNDRNLEEDPKP